MDSVFIGVDHRGYRFREKIKEFLHAREYHVEDLSGTSYDPEDDYSPIALSVAEKVAAQRGKGILMCGSGVGVCVAANKVAGVRAGLAISARQVASARRDDDINVLCIAADYIQEEELLEIIDAFLNTVFTPEERFVRRLATIKKYETLAFRP